MSRTVLIVEEQPVLRRQYARFLRDAGYEVVTASPVEEVERLIANASPGVIVIDPDSGAGKGMTIAEIALRRDPSVALVFNTSNPLHMGTDFSTWVADAYTVRSHAAEEVVGAVRRLLPLGIERGPGRRAVKTPTRRRVPSRA